MIETICCEVCLDLLPLVQDGVASDASKQLVTAHLAQCPACRAAMAVHAPEVPDDRRVLARLRRGLSLRLLCFLAFGILAGALLTYYGGYGAVFLLVLLPGIGAINQIFWRKKWWLSASATTVAFLVLGMVSLVQHQQINRYFFVQVPVSAVALGLLCLLGNAVAALFRFAFAPCPMDLKEEAFDEKT